MIRKKHLQLAAVLLTGLTGPPDVSRPVMAGIQSRDTESIQLKLSMGHRAASPGQRFVRLIGATEGVSASNLRGRRLEKNDSVTEAITRLNCGAGDVDEITADVSWIKPSAPLRKLAGHKDAYTVNDDAMWGYLMEHGSAGQSARLKDDSWFRPDAPVLTVLLSEDGTEGFSVALEQLQKHGAMWLPEHDVYLTLGDKPVDFKQHLASLKGSRVLDEVARQPDATLEAFQRAWPDIGNPHEWDVSWQTRWMGTRGHLTLTAPAHGSVYKFAIDRRGNVRPDFASPYKFRLDLNWPESTWKRQRITNGLPVLVTTLGKGGQSAEIEQFASPLVDLSETIRGYIPGIMFSKVTISGEAGPFSFAVTLDNELKGRDIAATEEKGKWILSDRQTGDIFLVLEAGKDIRVKAGEAAASQNGRQLTLTISGNLRAGENKEFIVKLPSPAVAPGALARLSSTVYDEEKKKTVDYWEGWIAKGAKFHVPEEAVNDLYRASLWHSLILPRHTLDIDGKAHMDLPYANTAYGQRNADWPINQAVYVDYMIYGLRGYDKAARDEYVAMFKSQQQPDGRIGGFANWGVYSPGQLYAIAQNFLLSGNKASFENLLPSSLKTLDWCLAQVARANEGENSTGLIVAPLNDLTNAEREWAFTQAYYVAGLELFAKALSVYGHGRAGEIAQAAARLKADVVREFSRSSVKSPVVQLADGTWVNFVPTDALTPRRMMEQWYPTDVDCGPLHLSRLGVFDAKGWLTTAMLHDHEDNLFLKNQGAANEPVYVQQAASYLMRDEPRAVIRAFYSLMACGFSHEQYTSLEHRWAWGQYYGPPSTDGAWFEIYRKMLLNEVGSDTLMIGQAIPQAWLESGKKIEVKDAPTYFGKTSFSIEGLNRDNEITATVNVPDREPPGRLLVRFRHPAGKPAKSVLVNGQPWKDFDVKKAFVNIPQPRGTYTIAVKY
ncbi:MAG: hypothetical protein ABS46_00365 [Cytophagaceae bacterium SCN 52-12]|nr:MAG: hypothetical protein ABS46_00365 [Cytophagaceae bacterium SCN 52-12]